VVKRSRREALPLPLGKAIVGSAKALREYLRWRAAAECLCPRCPKSEFDCVGKIASVAESDEGAGDAILRTLWAIFVATLTITSAAQAQPSQNFAGRTIRLYIGTSPGGGYDTYGRLVARHIGRQLPGNPAVVALNMPGASSLVLANFLFNQAPRDGTALGIINQAMPTEQYLIDQNVNYDAARFNWIGRVSSTVELLFVWHTVPVSRVEDVRFRETIMGGTGPTSSTEFIPRVLNNLAGMKFKIISGFKGTSDVALAMERGEIEGSGTPLESLGSYRANWVRDSKIKFLVQEASSRDPELPEVPAMVEMGPTEEARQILRFFASASEVGRSIVAPPGIPPETVNTLRRAFDAMFSDPAFFDDIKRAGIVVKPMTGERLQAAVAGVANFPRALIQKARLAREK
jgi:tripartite-type tricarboxylate transporter receptor subunit TctC